MIIHCTKKLAARLPAVSDKPLTETSPLGSWHASIYTIDRHHCLLFCHDETRYTVFLPGLRKEHFSELGRWFKEAFTASLAYMGMPDNHVRRAELAVGPVAFDTCTDRSVQGSLNQMRFLLDGRLHEVDNVMQLNPLSVTRWLCHYPVRIRNGKDCWLADQAMMDRVLKL